MPDVKMRDAQDDDDTQDTIVEQPQRNTTKARLPEECTLKSSAYNRSKLFVPDALIYDETRCSSSITQHVQRSSRFHSLTPLNNRTAAEYRCTSLRCWHDSHTFEGAVVPAPKSFDAKERRFVVYGCFCSLSCAKAFLLEKDSFDTPAQLVLLERMALEVYGVQNVVASPPRLTLDVYGGPYSIERFRSLSRACSATLVGEPYVSTYMVVEERELEGNKASSQGVNGIGSVRGLRRPSQPVQMSSSAPPETSPYLDFLAKKGVETKPPAKKEAPPVTTRASRSGTLAQFMKTD